MPVPYEVGDFLPQLFVLRVGWECFQGTLEQSCLLFARGCKKKGPSTACHSKQPIHAVPEIILRTMPLKAPRNFPSAHLDICSNLPEKDAHFELSCQSFCCVCYMVARHVEPREFLFSRARACECMCVCVCVLSVCAFVHLQHDLIAYKTLNPKP